MTEKIIENTSDHGLGWPNVEFYSPGYGHNEDEDGVVDAGNPHQAKLLSELYEKGLIWAINHSVLHQHGYAVGVKTNDSTGKVTEFMILKVGINDPDGEITFDKATGLDGYNKYLTNDLARLAP